MSKQIAAAVLVVLGAYGQDHAGVNRRGDQAMGFSHEKTRHHFLLTKTGGSIAVEAEDPGDTQSRDEIRRHLRHIASQFSAGNFDLPMFIHDRTPPGVATMKDLKAEMSYHFESTERGARVNITTKNSRALAAVHDFLKFQIQDHQTGDSLESK